MTNESHEQTIITDYQQLVKQVVKTAPAEILIKFNETENSWIACYKDFLTSIKMFLELSPDSEINEKAKQRLNALVSLAFDFGQIYFDKQHSPAEDLRKELLASLDVFNHDFYYHSTTKAA